MADRTMQILLVEDSPDDVLFTREAFADAELAHELHVVRDGDAAMAFLRRQGEHAGAPTPDLILLDLNLPRKDGREVLTEVKADLELREIPIVVLAEWSDPAPSTGLVFGAVGLLGAAADVEDLGPTALRVRAYAGYAGWGPGQLDAEFEREDWITAAATADDVFTDDPGNLWARVLERKGGRFALIARMPTDPSVN
ncbi:MAG TPA: YqgE/AlgH family protein [Solirubrobacteraceae bacterium]